MARGVALPIKDIEAMLKAKDGNVLATAAALGVSRSTINRRINESPVLQEVLHDARDGMVDIAESALKREVLAGNITAIIFTLKTLGKQRGYVERQEVTGAEGDALNIIIKRAGKDG